MGGVAAQMPIRRLNWDAQANKNAMEQVRQDKLREVLAGHDRTWMAHPALVSAARFAFGENIQEPKSDCSSPFASQNRTA